MATLEQTLQTLEAVLSHEHLASADALDEAIRAYLARVLGLDAQTEALDELSKAVLCLDLSARSMPALMDAIDRQWQMLRGQTA